MQARHDEQFQLRELVRDSARLQRAARVRDFIGAVEDRAGQDGNYTAEKQQWVAWVRAKADWLDPLMRRTDPILDTPEPERPNAWRF